MAWIGGPQYWQAAFWTGLILIAYVYALYPVLIIGLARWRRSPDWNSADAWPFVTILIAAHNEADAIEARLLNAIKLDYPPDRIDIVVASDGSSDRTVANAHSVRDLRVRVLDFQPNRGKALTHNDAVPACRGDIVVFTDADKSSRRSPLRLGSAAWWGISCTGPAGPP